MKDTLQSIITILLNFLGRFITAETFAHTFINKIKDQINETKLRAKKMLIGICIIIASLVFWVTTVFFLFVALFCYFGQLTNLVSASILTALICLAIALLISAIGAGLINASTKKTPR